LASSFNNHTGLGSSRGRCRVWELGRLSEIDRATALLRAMEEREWERARERGLLVEVRIRGGGIGNGSGSGTGLEIARGRRRRQSEGSMSCRAY
jgi:hypothetical protein